MKVMLKILQLLIKASIIFVLFFVWLRFYLNSIWQVFALSIFFTIILLIILSNYQKNKTAKTYLKTKEQQEAEQMFELLIKNQDTNFFYNLLKQRNSNTITHKDFFTIKTQEKKDVVLYPHLKIQSLNHDNLLEILNKLTKIKKDKLIICCNSYDKNIENFITQFDYEILILDKYTTYQYLFKEYDFYPELPIKKEKNAKTKFKELLSYSFDRNKAKSYFFSAIFLLAISFTINTNLYYCIVASLLILCSLICLIKPTTKENKINNIL